MKQAAVGDIKFLWVLSDSFVPVPSCLLSPSLPLSLSPSTQDQYRPQEMKYEAKAILSFLSSTSGCLRSPRARGRHFRLLSPMSNSCVMYFFLQTSTYEYLLTILERPIESRIPDSSGLKHGLRPRSGYALAVSLGAVSVAMEWRGGLQTKSHSLPSLARLAPCKSDLAWRTSRQLARIRGWRRRRRWRPIYFAL